MCRTLPFVSPVSSSRFSQFDNCNNDNVDPKLRYIPMSNALNASGRPIVFSACIWGVSQVWRLPLYFESGTLSPPGSRKHPSLSTAAFTYRCPFQLTAVGVDGAICQFVAY